MEHEAESMDLTGKLLIAMPGMGDPRFEKAVILMCAHSPDGALGLIVNKPMPDLAFADLLRQLKIPGAGSEAPEIRVHFGGPVEHGRGFVLHSPDYDSNTSTLKLGEFGMTATIDILQHIAQGQGPERALLALGYSGWGPGQLEDEILHNGWLVVDADPALVFSSENPAKWARALAKLGVDPLSLSADAGHA